MAYLLFAGNDYYPRGGALDLKGKFNSIDDAIAEHDPNEFEYDGGWANILCLHDFKIVKLFERGLWSDPDLI